MGKLYWLNWKLYLKTIYLPAVYLLLLGYGVVLSLKHLAAREYLMLFQNGLTSILAQLGMLCFTFFLFEAYEFLHKSGDRDLRESLRSINSGERKTVASQLLVLFSLVLLTFLLAAAVALLVREGLRRAIGEKGVSGPMAIVVDMVACLAFIIVTYVCGCFQYAAVVGIDLAAAFMVTIAPFAVPDLLKAVAAVLCARAVLRALPKR